MSDADFFCEMQTPEEQHSFPTDMLMRAICGEVTRLTSDEWKPPSGTLTAPQVAGRPIWWWRVKLLEWTRTKPIRGRFDPAELRGVRDLLRALKESDLCVLVRSCLIEGSDGGQRSA